MSVASKRGWRSRRRLALASIGGFCAALAVGSVAFACTAIQGNTYFSDGTTAKSGGTGTVITAFGNNARIQKPFQLVAGTSNEPGHTDHGCMDVAGPINTATRMSSIRGFIPNTTGAVNRAPGDWQICFAELPLDGLHSVTAPATISII